MIPRINQIVFLIICLLLSACSLKQKPPEVRLVGLLVQDATLFETSLLIEVRVENDNPEDIEIGGGVHKLYINGEYVGKGYDKNGFTLPRLDSVVVPVTVFVNNLSLLTKLQNMAASSKLKYKVESELYTKMGRTAFRGMSFSATSEGSISLEELDMRRQIQPLY